MESQHNPNEPGKPTGPGQQGGQDKDREKQERERQQREREKQGGGGQQGGGRRTGRRRPAARRTINLVLSDYSDGGGQLPPFACPCADRLQLQTNLQPPRS